MAERKEIVERAVNTVSRMLGEGDQHAAAAIRELLEELVEETEGADNWRRLALQFDNHRMQALGHLKAILHSDSSVDEYKAAELFLKAPPLDGEEVLAQRIAELAAAATQAQEDACWSGWACMYPGKLPRLYGALEIASVNLDAANGDRLIRLSTSPDPKAQADAEDQDVLTMANALIAQRTTDALDAARYRFLRDTCWSSDKELATVISLQMNKVWDEKIDEAMARNKEE